MKEIDKFSRNLLEESKRFLQKAELESSEEGRQGYMHASLVLGFSALEAYINAIADDLLVRKDIPLLDKAILSEKEVVLANGKFVLNDQLKIYRLEDRIQFLYRKYSGKEVDKGQDWWQQLKAGMYLRNQLTHPKVPPVITLKKTQQAIQAIISTIDVLFKVIYKGEFPIARKRLDSSMTF